MGDSPDKYRVVIWQITSKISPVCFETARHFHNVDQIRTVMFKFTHRYGGLFKLLTCLSVIAASASHVVAQHDDLAKDAKITESADKIFAELLQQRDVLKNEIIEQIQSLNQATSSRCAHHDVLLEIDQSLRKLEIARQDRSKFSLAQDLVNEAKIKWIQDAEKQIELTKEKLRKAQNGAERNAVRTDLTRWEARKKEGQKILQEREINLAQMKSWLPVYEYQFERATADLDAIYAKMIHVLEKVSSDAKGKSDAKSTANVADPAICVHQKVCRQIDLAMNHFNDAKSNLLKISGAKGLVGQAKTNLIGNAEKEIAKAQEKLQQATTEQEKNAARADMEKWNQIKISGLEVLKGREYALSKLIPLEPLYKQQLDACEVELAAAYKSLDTSQSEAPDCGQCDFQKICQEFNHALKLVHDAEQDLGKITAAKDLVHQTKTTWLKKTNKGLADAQLKLKQADTEEKKNAALKELTEWKNDEIARVEALKAQELAYVNIASQQPVFKIRLEDAKAALQLAHCKLSMRLIADTPLVSAAVASDSSEPSHCAFHDVCREIAHVLTIQDDLKMELDRMNRAKTLFNQAKNLLIDRADKGIAQANDSLKKAKIEEEQISARAGIAKWEENKKAGQKALDELEPLLNVIISDQPAYQKRQESSKKALAVAFKNMELTLSLGQVQEGDNLAKFYNARRKINELIKADVLAKENMSKLQQAERLVKQAQNNWIGDAVKGIDNAHKVLREAVDEGQKQQALADLSRWQQNKKEGLEALKARRAALAEIKVFEEEYKRQCEYTLRELPLAHDAMAKVVGELEMTKVLKSNKLDAKLAKFVILKQAAQEISGFAAKSNKQKKLVDQLLEDEALMIRMLVADGAKGNQYGRAMQIYQQILKLSEKAKSGHLNRLALAVALEHAVPLEQINPTAAKNAPKFVDPLKRYQHFEKAFLAGELDPGLDKMSTWDYRYLVNGNEPDDLLKWARDMLKVYRPDHLRHEKEKDRYVRLVNTDVQWSTKEYEYDQDNLHLYQNTFMNGGTCGRRAHMGRFLLRAHGIPTVARPQRRHASLARWTSEGWKIALGAKWGYGKTPTSYIQDIDFYHSSRARTTGESFMEVMRAHWIGELMGESRVWGLIGTDPHLWNCVALYTQRKIVLGMAEPKSDITVSTESEIDDAIAKAYVVPEADRSIKVNANGVISLPAVATSTPASDQILFMASVDGGSQMHCSRNEYPQWFHYSINVPKAGKYSLTAKLSTPTGRQSLALTVNSDSKHTIPLPYTMGLWGHTKPITLDLMAGANTLSFLPASEVNPKGLTIKEFALSPLK